jgi:hypothetical protein
VEAESEKKQKIMTEKNVPFGRNSDRAVGTSSAWNNRIQTGVVLRESGIVLKERYPGMRYSPREDQARASCG